MSWNRRAIRRCAAGVLAAFLIAGLNGCTQADARPPGTAYTLETVVTCGAGGSCERFQRSGWSEPEQSFTWTTRVTAKLKFSAPPLQGPLGLRMRLIGNIDPPELDFQVVEVFANGTKVATWAVEAPEDFFAIIPAEVVRPDGKLYVELRIPRAQQLPDSAPDESRRFGVGCYEIELSRAASVPLAQDVPRPVSES